jgi:plastocyanin
MKKIIYIFLLGGLLFAKDYIVDQRDKTFIPHELRVHVGDTITFLNHDPFAHNAFTDDPANNFDIGVQKPGERKTIRVKAAGKFDIECAIHPNMLLEVTVE